MTMAVVTPPPPAADEAPKAEEKKEAPAAEAANDAMPIEAQVKALIAQGRKIEAIKLLRDIFTTRLGLREAKDIVEILCS